MDGEVNFMLASFIKGFYPGLMDYRRIYVGYFAPIIAVFRLVKKRSWNYLRQIRVAYRYAFWGVKVRGRV